MSSAAALTSALDYKKRKRNKRRNIPSHLSDDEKEKIRKRNNRAAAQSLRDRKKQHEQRLEQTATALDEKNRQLAEQVGVLESFQRNMKAQLSTLERIVNFVSMQEDDDLGPPPAKKRPGRSSSVASSASSSSSSSVADCSTDLQSIMTDLFKSAPFDPNAAKTLLGDAMPSKAAATFGCEPMLQQQHDTISLTPTFDEMSFGFDGLLQDQITPSDLGGLDGFALDPFDADCPPASVPQQDGAREHTPVASLGLIADDLESLFETQLDQNEKKKKKQQQQQQKQVDAKPLSLSEQPCGDLDDGGVDDDDERRGQAIQQMPQLKTSSLSPAANESSDDDGISEFDTSSMIRTPKYSFLFRSLQSTGMPAQQIPRQSRSNSQQTRAVSPLAPAVLKQLPLPSEARPYLLQLLMLLGLQTMLMARCGSRMPSVWPTAIKSEEDQDGDSQSVDVTAASELLNSVIMVKQEVEDCAGAVTAPKQHLPVRELSALHSLTMVMLHLVKQLNRRLPDEAWRDLCCNPSTLRSSSDVSVSA